MVAPEEEGSCALGWLIILALFLGLLSHPVIVCSTAPLLLSSPRARKHPHSNLFPSFSFPTVCVNLGGLVYTKAFHFFYPVLLLEVVGTDVTSHFLFYMSWMDWITWVMTDDGIPSCTRISYHVTIVFGQLCFLLSLLRLVFGAQPHVVKGNRKWRTDDTGARETGRVWACRFMYT